jgi:hypothetical protein
MRWLGTWMVVLVITLLPAHHGFNNGNKRHGSPEASANKYACCTQRAMHGGHVWIASHQAVFVAPICKAYNSFENPNYWQGLGSKIRRGTVLSQRPRTKKTFTSCITAMLPTMWSKYLGTARDQSLLLDMFCSLTSAGSEESSAAAGSQKPCAAAKISSWTND